MHCERCNGNGWVDDVLVRCTQCRGTGDAEPMVRLRESCPCHGRNAQCSCNGTGAQHRWVGLNELRELMALWLR